MALDHHYAVVIDAGSTSSRLFVYHWVKPTEDEKIPYKVELVFPIDKAQKQAARNKDPIHHITSGNVEEKVEAYLESIIKAATDYLKGKVNPNQVPAYLLGTGGMRSIYGDNESEDGKRAEAILQATQAVLADKFKVEDAPHLTDKVHNKPNARVIEGEDEGRYAWVALNYGRIEPEQFAGILEMGGATVQVAYKDRSGIQDKRGAICLVSGKHMVYSETWDSYGSKSARGLMRGLLPEDGGVIEDPCLPLDQNVYFCEDGVVASNRVGCLRAGDDTIKHEHHGTGHFEACKMYAKASLDNLAQESNHHALPSYLDIDHYAERFLGVATFAYTFQFFSKWGGYDANEAYDRRLFQAAVKAYCVSSWKDIKWDTLFDLKKQKQVIDPEKTDPFISERCFNAAWMTTVLHDHKHGLGMDMSQYDTWRGLLRFPTTPDLESRSTWTLGVAVLVARHGKLVYESANGCPSPNVITTIKETTTINRCSSYTVSPTVTIFLPASAPIHDHPAPDTVPAQGNSPTSILFATPMVAFLVSLAFLLLLILGYLRRYSVRYVRLPSGEDTQELPQPGSASPLSKLGRASRAP